MAALAKVYFDLIALLGYGRSGESPWLWLIVPAVGGALYLLDRSRSRGSGQPMKRFTDFADPPWWLQASVFAMIGGGTLYHFATHQDRWYWWLLPTAWHAFAAGVIRRKPQ